MNELHPLVHQHTQNWCRPIRQSKAKGQLSTTFEEDYVLIAREDFFNVEKFCFCLRGPRRMMRALNIPIFASKIFIRQIKMTYTGSVLSSFEMLN